MNWKFHIVTILVLLSCYLVSTLLKDEVKNEEEDIFALHVSFSQPKPYSVENSGVRVNISVYNQHENRYDKVLVLVDSLSSSFWLISNKYNNLESENNIDKGLTCEQKLKFNNDKEQINKEIILEYTQGIIKGNLDFKKIYLKSITIENQPVLLANSIDFPLLIASELNGVLGISYNYSSLHKYNQYKSVLQRVENYMNSTNKVYLIINLGVSVPYIKIDKFEDYDYDTIRNKSSSNDQKEDIIWFSLPISGRLTLSLNNIRLIYLKNGLITKSVKVANNCSKFSCKAHLDTKSYYISGPSYQTEFIKDLVLQDYCVNNVLEELPYIEFSFFNHMTDKNFSTSTVEVVLEPKHYMIDTENKCMSGIITHKSDYAWSLGILFMKNFLIAYDFTQDKVGLVRIKDTN